MPLYVDFDSVASFEPVVVDVVAVAANGERVRVRLVDFEYESEDISEVYLLFRGFHFSLSGSWVKSAARKRERTLGAFEHIPRKRQPPNLSHDVSFMGQYPASA